MNIVFEFQSTRPLGGATEDRRYECMEVVVSIHAPPGGRDVAPPHPNYGNLFVSIHAPPGGRDLTRTRDTSRLRGFNPRAPWGARRQRAALLSTMFNVSIHAPPGGRDRQVVCMRHRLGTFQSTRPLGGATFLYCFFLHGVFSFNPRAPWGARRA